MIALAGCAQGAIAPSTNAAAASVLDKLGISLVEISGAGCCGAVDLHTTSEDKARAVAKKLIDQWLPHLDEGIEAIVMTASGCGVTIKDYPHLFRHDPEYFEKATSIAGVTRDLSEILDNEISDLYTVSQPGSRVAFHSPCTLQHGQKLAGKVEGILRRVGYELTPIRDGHMCCGSAGTYSLFQPEISTQLRDNKLQALTAGKPDVVCTANIGCQAHLFVQGQPPVRHWIELLL
jgi:glycolate oxidase iron-sulfur subunit